MKNKPKKGYHIEGFQNEHAYRSRMYGSSGISSSVELLYQGKTSKIPMDILSTKVEGIKITGHYKFYYGDIDVITTVENAIKSTVPMEYTIIYQEKPHRVKWWHIFCRNKGITINKTK